MAAHADGVLVHGEQSLSVLDVETGDAVHTVPTKKLRLVVAGPDGGLFVIAQRGEITRIDPQ